MAPLTKSDKLIIIIVISSSFFLAEISVGFHTESLALIADAFHYLNDLIGFIVALVAIKAGECDGIPQELSYGYQRATLLGAFFNGVFLLALGVSILLQGVERFVTLHIVENPRLIVIVGCVGFGLNIISAAILHEHDHGSESAQTARIGNSTDPPAVRGDGEIAATVHQQHFHCHRLKERDYIQARDLGLLAVLVHVVGDALNNIGVIVGGTIIWHTKSPKRFYADPAVSIFIAIMVLFSSIPIVRRSGYILLDAVPSGVDPIDVKHDIKLIPGVYAIHELHIRRLTQQKAIASAHVVVSETELSEFEKIANTISECFHAYGIHSVTLQPETIRNFERASIESRSEDSRGVPLSDLSCRLGCSVTTCDLPSCCN